MIFAALVLLLPAVLAETIAEIRGSKFQSPLNGRSVTDVAGVVTVCDHLFTSKYPLIIPLGKIRIRGFLVDLY